MNKYGFVVSVIAFLLVGGGWLYAGIKQVQKAKARGGHIPWWKQSQIVIALVFGCGAVLLLTPKLIPDQSNNVFILSAIFLFLLFSLGVSIYAIILLWKQRSQRREGE